MKWIYKDYSIGSAHLDLKGNINLSFKFSIGRLSNDNILGGKFKGGKLLSCNSLFGSDSGYLYIGKDISAI